MGTCWAREGSFRERRAGRVKKARGGAIRRKGGLACCRKAARFGVPCRALPWAGLGQKLGVV